MAHNPACDRGKKEKEKCSFEEMCSTTPGICCFHSTSAINSVQQMVSKWHWFCKKTPCECRHRQTGIRRTIQKNEPCTQGQVTWSDRMYPKFRTIYRGTCDRPVLLLLVAVHEVYSTLRCISGACTITLESWDATQFVKQNWTTDREPINKYDKCILTDSAHWGGTSSGSGG